MLFNQRGSVNSHKWEYVCEEGYRHQQKICLACDLFVLKRHIKGYFNVAKTHNPIDQFFCTSTHGIDCRFRFPRAARLRLECPKSVSVGDFWGWWVVARDARHINRINLFRFEKTLCIRFIYTFPDKDIEQIRI